MPKPLTPEEIVANLTAEDFDPDVLEEAWKHRYYNIPPEQVTVEKAAQFGLGHGSYGSNPQIDPRWSPEVAKAYEEAYLQAAEQHQNRSPERGVKRVCPCCHRPL